MTPSGQSDTPPTNVEPATWQQAMALLALSPAGADEAKRSAIEDGLRGTCEDVPSYAQGVVQAFVDTMKRRLA